MSSWGYEWDSPRNQSAPNLHSPLNLEQKSLQDVYQATQSEPIRASYRPVEFALFKKNSSERAGNEEKESQRERKSGRVWDSLINALLRAGIFQKKVLQHVDQPPSPCCVSNHMCPKSGEFARLPARGASRATLRACSLRWAGSSTHHGIDFYFFLWTIGAAPSRGGGLEKKHLYGIKATERMKERLKVGGGEKGRIFLATVSGVLEKCSDAGLSINKSEQAAHVRTKWIRDGTFLRLHNRLSRPCIKYSVYSASCGGIFRGVLSEDRVNAEAFLRFSRTWCNYKRRLLG